MDISGRIKNTDKSKIMGIVSRSLGYIDERLVNHGERVAFIADKIASMDESLDVDREQLLILSLLHDIGAYKTEEIDKMVQFETGEVENHSVYGYVFLKNTTHIGESAEALLYHHTHYDEMLHIDTPHKTAAGLIFLADRIDILIAGEQAPNLGSLRAMAGTVFSPRLVELFFKAQEKYDLVARIRDGSFASEVEARLADVSFSSAETASFLGMLVYSIDFRSPYTVTHTANTIAISSALCELLGVSERERHSVELGAFLHDIGKISIPYGILENPGKLTDAQMATMRTHVEKSEEILRGNVPDEVCDIAARHHEKLNGTGYPRGLEANDLSLPQRIVAVADILSALISRRSYKEPFPKEKALSIITQMRDAGELCARVCDMVIDEYDYIVEIIDKTDDPVIELYETIQSEYAKHSAALSAASNAR